MAVWRRFRKLHIIHQAAVWTVIGAWAEAMGLGSLFAGAEHLSEGLGLYWAVTTVTTTGYGDIIPHTTAGHWVACAAMVTAIPLWSASIALFGSGFVATLLHAVEHRIKAHVTVCAPGTDGSSAVPGK